jgi:hypothetical protein
MQTPRLTTELLLLLLLLLLLTIVFCTLFVPLATPITPGMVYQPAHGMYCWYQPDCHIEPSAPFYPLVSSETRTVTGSFTEFTGGQRSRPSSAWMAAPDQALLTLMLGAGKSAHHDLEPHDFPMRA